MHSLADSCMYPNGRMEPTTLAYPDSALTGLSVPFLHLVSFLLLRLDNCKGPVVKFADLSFYFSDLLLNPSSEFFISCSGSFQSRISGSFLSITLFIGILILFVHRFSDFL